MRAFRVSIVGVSLACAAAAEAAPDSASLSELPLAAQAQISAALGREQSSYHASTQADGFRLENPQHRLSVDFTGAAVRVRTGTATWSMSLLGYGYGDELSATMRVGPHATANRVEYRRGDVTEWYLNGPLGLEQGFTLARAPAEGTGGPLTLAFEASGNVTASADASGRNLILTAADGLDVLRYSGLTAQDATGRDLRAWLEVEHDRFSLRVDDTGAQYPLVVDPFIQLATLTASDGAASDRFGGVAMDGDTIVVGVKLDDIGTNADQGSAYVFVRPVGGWSGALTESARLIASDGAAADVLGSVAIDGDTIVVGANGCPDGNVCNTQPVSARGSAYVFVKPVGGWSGTLTEQAKLIASDGASNDQFGNNVAVEGDTIVVSSEWDDSFRGSAYVFLKPAAGWSGTRTESAKLIASDRGPIGSGIGQALGRARIAGDTIVAGALGADVIGTDGFNRVDAGAAYVWVKPAAGWSGTLGHSAKLITSDRAANDRFGATIDVNDGTIVVSAPFDDLAGSDGLNRVDAGSVYVFVKPAAGWAGTRTENAKLIASDRATNDNLGRGPLRVNADTITVGAPFADSGLAVDAGAVYRFIKPAGGWIGTLTEADKLTAFDGAAGDAFGAGLAVSGAVASAGPDQTVDEGAVVVLDDSASTGQILAVSASGDDIGANVDQGSAYVFAVDLLFSWQQIAGPAIALSDPTRPSPSFTAPQLSGGSQVLTFQLTVTSSTESKSDTVNVTVVNVNRAPVAEAGGDQIVNEGSPVALDGSASFDPDGDATSHEWIQIGGTLVELTGADTAAPSFTAPLLAGGTGSVDTLVFELSVFDGALTGTDRVQVIVEQVNHPPLADAGADQTINEGSVVALDGSASSDPDIDPITYSWSQLSGPTVALSDAHSATPSFAAPVIGPGGAALVFELTVSDGLLSNGPAAAEPDERVTINVINVNDPPLCSAAQASPDLLWPPNHKMVEIRITGVADPSDDQLQIAISSVTQDEPLNGLGDGDTSPDAVILGDSVLLRAERSGNGSGRVYAIHFTASDSTGGSCAGSVHVGVPRSMKPGASAVDSGQLYDSTSP